ncbi:hypothetical protein ACFL96_14020 [Thermoproteota archaeon]
MKSDEEILSSEINKEILRKEQNKKTPPTPSTPKPILKPVKNKNIGYIQLDKRIRVVANMCARKELMDRRLWVEDLILKVAKEKYGISIEEFEARIDDN